MITIASKKISYNDLKKNTDNSQLAAAFSAGKTVVSKNSAFETVKVSDIRADPKGDFAEVFAFNQAAADAIAESMIAKGYDKTQVIHLVRIMEEPDTMESPIRLDGAHRVAAAKTAGIEEIPAYVHTFETRTEALIYAYELQLLRRNLEPYQKLDAMAKLDRLKNPGRKTDVEATGKSSEEIASVLGISPRTAERMRNIISNGEEDIVEAVKSGELSISAADKKINASKKKKAREDTPNPLDSAEEEFSDFNSRLSSGLPAEETSVISDCTVVVPEEAGIRIEQEAAVRQAFSDGILKGLMFALGEVKRGKSPEEVWNDDRVKDLSPQVIYNFEVPPEDEDIVNGF